MTVEAIIDVHEGAAGTGEEALGGQVVVLPGSRQQAAPVGQVLPAPARRHLAAGARLGLPVVVASLVAVLTQAPPLAAAVLLTAWLVLHLQTAHLRLGSSVPGPAELVRRTALPFALVGLGVAGGLLPEHALTASLPILLSATGALVGTALVLRGRRRPQRVLVVGDRESVGRAALGWADCPDVHLVGAAVLGDDGSAPDLETFGLPAVPGTEDLPEQVRRHRADTVVVLPSTAVGSAEIRRLGWALEGTDATLAVRTELESAGAHRVAVSHVAGCTLVEVAPSRAPWHVRTLKALVDRVGAALLLVLLSPLLLVIVVLVRLESRGPALFTQTRIGRDGRPFTVYKVRTMCLAAEEIKPELGGLDEGNGVLFKVRRDPRITRVGGPLRRTSLDELPQLLNVLKGDMSLVGPRPALPVEVEKYDETARRRLAVRPGITGLWQVNGRSDLDWETAVSLDVRYTDNVTVTGDLAICLRTVGAVTSGKGAY